MLSFFLFLPLCLYFRTIDFAVLSMIWLFQDEGNSYRMQDISLILREG